MRRALLVLAALGLAFALGVALFNFVILPSITKQNQTVVVPRLVGLEFQAAAKLCEARDLRIAVEDRRHSEGTPPDRVLSQSPPPDTQVKPDRTVRVHLSLGTELVRIPDLRGATLRQARLQLENANLTVGRVSRIHEGEAGQIVRATRPRAGSETAAGNAIDVLVAVGEGAEPFSMPSLRGRPLDEVRQLIVARGFRVGRIEYRERNNVYPGTILEHSPAHGALILRGEAIDLVAATPD